MRMHPTLALIAVLAACESGPDAGQVAEDAIETANRAVTETLTEVGLGEPVDYTLTIEKARAWRAAMQRVEGLKSGEEKAVDLQGDNVLAELEAELERDPRMVEAIRAEGLTVREFSILTVLLPQALVIHETRKAGVDLSFPMVTDDHVAFVAAHEAELRRILDDD